MRTVFIACSFQWLAQISESSLLLLFQFLWYQVAFIFHLKRSLSVFHDRHSTCIELNSRVESNAMIFLQKFTNLIVFKSEVDICLA